MFYKVTAKCGHVGRNNYIEKDFFVKADSGRDAALIVRCKPRVKHDRKDAILSVKRESQRIRYGKARDKEYHLKRLRIMENQSKQIVEEAFYGQA